MKFPVSFVALSPTGNYRAGAAATINNPTQINALALTGSQVGGTGTIRLGSGVLLDSAGTTVLNPIDFGSAEGLILNPVFAVQNPTTILSGPISGTGGVLISGSLPVVLGGVNSFSGGLTLNSGSLTFSSLANLGADTTPVVVNSGVMRYAGTSPLTLPREIGRAHV